jgi:hypothetical protein
MGVIDYRVACDGESHPRCPKDGCGFVSEVEKEATAMFQHYRACPLREEATKVRCRRICEAYWNGTSWEAKERCPNATPCS